MIGREAKKREAKRATSQERIKKTKTLDGQNMHMDEKRVEAEGNAQDYADANKLDLTGGTVTGGATFSGGLTSSSGATLGGTTAVTGKITAPGSSNFTLNDTDTHSHPHGLGIPPALVLVQRSADGGTTWSPVAHGVGGWTLTFSSTNVTVTNNTGSTYLVRVRVLG